MSDEAIERRGAEGGAERDHVGRDYVGAVRGRLGATFREGGRQSVNCVR
ncbi:hypothetical protein ACF3NS_11630 [Arsenicicoccus cauae]|uniref:Uncharacterized protein n=1 Tax=Arsenicicoccus cauae TaxID=2663847 RepID=A0A6I3I9V9_9MICO|nr:hypothetical protein [Arsenicicoccus cauae]MTB72984.1 hypothetical protein [Arsenicicoccus cauae]